MPCPPRRPTGSRPNAPARSPPGRRSGRKQPALERLQGRFGVAVDECVLPVASGRGVGRRGGSRSRRSARRPPDRAGGTSAVDGRSGRSRARADRASARPRRPGTSRRPDRRRRPASAPPAPAMPARRSGRRITATLPNSDAEPPSPSASRVVDVDPIAASRRRAHRSPRRGPGRSRCRGCPPAVWTRRPRSRAPRPSPRRPASRVDPAQRVLLKFRCPRDAETS